MCDPRYSHEFYPNKKGLCKVIVGNEMCHKPHDAIEHVRWKERRPVTKPCPICDGTGEQGI